MFNLTKAAVAHMKPGSAIINTASINSDQRSGRRGPASARRRSRTASNIDRT
jgi:NAD(P)-dependent dehydrogenase (short-subunit alcohol dehydrogenase family)